MMTTPQMIWRPASGICITDSTLCMSTIRMVSATVPKTKNGAPKRPVFSREFAPV